MSRLTLLFLSQLLHGRSRSYALLRIGIHASRLLSESIQIKVYRYSISWYRPPSNAPIIHPINSIIHISNHVHLGYDRVLLHHVTINVLI